MDHARRRYGLSETSPLLSVPATLRVRCPRTACLGTECENWRCCGPASPFGNYLAHLPHSFVQGCETSPKASPIPA